MHIMKWEMCYKANSESGRLQSLSPSAFFIIGENLAHFLKFPQEGLIQEVPHEPGSTHLQ